MSEGALKEVGDLLGSILVFETKFKEEVLLKAKTMSPDRLSELVKILSEVNQWQKKVLEQKIKEDPNFYNRVAEARKNLDQEVIDLYKQKLNNEDKKKMEIILNKMKMYE